MEELLEQLREYFRSMTQEEKVKEWAEYDKYNSVGPTVNEYLNEYLNECLKTKKQETMIIRGFTELDLINSLRNAINLAGDGGFSPWQDGEYEALREYLDHLENQI